MTDGLLFRFELTALPIIPPGMTELPDGMLSVITDQLEKQFTRYTFVGTNGQIIKLRKGEVIPKEVNTAVCLQPANTGSPHGRGHGIFYGDHSFRKDQTENGIELLLVFNMTMRARYFGLLGGTVPKFEMF